MRLRPGRQKDPMIKEAKRYWRGTLRRWRKEKASFSEKILVLGAEQGQDMAVCVAALADGISEGYGAFVFVSNPDHTMVGSSNLDLDEDFVDMLAEQFGEDVVEAAGHWLLSNLNGLSMGFIAWCFKHIRADGGEALTADRIVYNIQKQAIIGVVQSDGGGMVPLSLC